MHVLVAAAHLSAFRDDPSSAPLSPMSRLALAAFLQTMLVFQALGVARGHQTSPPMSRFAYTVQANSYTYPTRNAMLAVLPGLAALFHVQADGSPTPFPFVPSTCGSQACESAFAEFRDCRGLQNTGTVSCGSILRQIPRVDACNKAVAEGTLVVNQRRKDGKHVAHPVEKYVWKVSDEDITR